MYISWYGQSCFRFQGKDVSLLLDPFSKELGLRVPKIEDQIVLVTHEHFDHNNTEEMPGSSTLINTPGEYEISSIFIQGILSYHDDKEGAERGLNTIFSIKFEELNLCHMGDFGQSSLAEQQLEKIGDVDILFIPVGGKYTIDAKGAVEIIQQIEPKIIVPMHYKIPGLKADLEGVDKFIKELSISPEKIDKKTRIAKKELPIEETKLWVFNT